MHKIYIRDHKPIK